MEKIMNEKNELDHMVEPDVEGRLEKLARNEIMKAMQKMKSEWQLDHLKLVWR